MNKPSACSGCPAEHRGHLFVPDDHKPHAKVRIIAQNPGEAEVLGRRFVRWYKGEEGTGEIWEEDVPRPLIGKSGYELDHKFLPLAGLTRDEVECCNVVRCRLGNSNDLPPLTTNMARDMVMHCQRAYWKEPANGQTLVALGAYALWALTQEYEGDEDDADHADDDLRAARSVDGWRGWMLPYKPAHRDVPMSDVQVFVTFHPAYYWRAHWLKAVGKMDWARLGRYLRGTWPEPFPEIQTHKPLILPAEFAFDTEYNPHTKRLYRYSIGWRGVMDEPYVHVVECTNEAEDIQCLVPETAKDLAMSQMWRAKDPSRAQVVSQVLPRRLPHLEQAAQEGSVPTQDDEEQVSGVSAPRATSAELEGSIGRNRDNSSGILQGSQEAEGTLRNLSQEEAPRNRSLSPQNDRPRVRMLLVQFGTWAFEGQRGISPSPGVIPLKVIFQNAEADVDYLAQVLPVGTWVDWDDCMPAHSVLYGTLRHSLDFMGSLYARHNRWKHLQQSDPLTYSGMDALATYDIWQQLSRELARDPLSQALYEHELKPLLPHVMARPPVHLNAMHIAQASSVLKCEQDEIAQRAQAVAGWPLNVSSADQVSRWLRLKRDA